MLRQIKEEDQEGKEARIQFQEHNQDLQCFESLTGCVNAIATLSNHDDCRELRIREGTGWHTATRKGHWLSTLHLDRTTASGFLG
jgi:hypothetical protein